MTIEEIEALNNQKQEDEPQEGTTVHTLFRCGPAGSGKTTSIKKAIQEDENYGVLCASTGIAAINLGTTTLNSTLKYFDTASLRDKFNSGQLTSLLHRIGKKTKRLVIDEVSMMDGLQLDYIFKAMEAVNKFKDMEGEPMGIVLTGDLLQLPPVNAKWVFEAECWPYFESNTEILTKIYRQSNPRFLEALTYARKGMGKESVEILKSIGVKFVASSNGKYPGTTIMSKNDKVDNYNYSRLLDLPGNAFGLKTTSWGEQSGEWKNIPPVLKLKIGAYVMILSNDTSGLFEYANGDCGHIVEMNKDSGAIHIKLVRNEQVVEIGPIVRNKSVSSGDHMVKDLDESGEDVHHNFCSIDCGHTADSGYTPWGYKSYNCGNGTWVVGGLKYYPIRLAYATTVHKSQGLTLDNCQIDCRDVFFSNPGSAYVALSRCRTSEGLTIVGSVDVLSKKIKMDPRVSKWA